VTLEGPVDSCAESPASPPRRRIQLLKYVMGASIAGVACLALASFAYGAVRVAFKASVSPNKTNKPAGLKIRFESKDPAAEQPPIMNRVVIKLNAGGKFNGSKFPKCTEQILLAQGTAGCPPKSRIGCKCLNPVTGLPGKADGYGVGFAKPAVVEPVEADLFLFNGGNSVLVYVFPNLGPQFVTTCKVVGGYSLDCTIPPIETIRNAPDASVGTVDTNTPKQFFKKGGKRYALIVTPKKCKRVWKAEANFYFATGERVKSRATTRCRK
jgi:hypothetical protein